MLNMMMIKRDPSHPTRFYVEPPLYGNYQSQSRNNYSLMRDKLQHISRAEQRSTVGSQHGPSTPSPASSPWRAAIPGGTDVCLQFGKGSLSSSKKGGVPPSKNGSRQKGGGNHHQESQNEILLRSNKETAHSPFQRVPPPSPSTTPRKDNKQFFNVMWDPRIARGTTMVSFTTAQRAKCKHFLELNRSMHFRHGSNDTKSRRRQRRDDGDGSQADGHPSGRNGRIHPPEVKTIKEPLCYSSFAPFLTDTTEVAFEDRGQSTVDDPIDDPEKKLGDGLPGYRKNYLSGVSQEVPAKAENEPCREGRTDWIVSNLKEKIPEQALLEVMEEAEMDAIRGQVHKYEMKMLYRKWQEMKEDQWNEWLSAWEKIRREEIEEEEKLLEILEERMGSLGFSKGAISHCYSKTSEEMKTDGFIDKASGVPFEELENIGNYLKIFEDAAKKRYDEVEVVSREVVDTTIVRAVVHRFGHHMRDDFGKPHGIWLSRRKGPASVDFDTALGYYLEHSFPRRNKQAASVASIDSDFDPIQSDTELFDQTTEVIPESFKRRAEKLGTQGHIFSLKKKAAGNVHVNVDHHGTKHVEIRDATGAAEQDAQSERGSLSLAETSSNAIFDDVDVIFKRKTTSWSRVQYDDDDEDDGRKNSASLGAALEVDKLRKIQGGENGTGDDNAPS